MIKFRASMKAGGSMYGFGLSVDNVAQLVAGDPALIPLGEIDPALQGDHVLIFYGETDADIKGWLVPLMDSDTVEHFPVE